MGDYNFRNLSRDAFIVSGGLVGTLAGAVPAAAAASLGIIIGEGVGDFMNLGQFATINDLAFGIGFALPVGLKTIPIGGVIGMYIGGISDALIEPFKDIGYGLTREILKK